MLQHEQPEALRLADALERIVSSTFWPAAAAEELRRLYSVNEELLKALKSALPYVVTQSVGCHGYKCRENWCWSCNSEKEAEAAAQAGCDAYSKASAAIAKAEGSK